MLFATGQLGYLIEITANQYRNIAVGAAAGGFAFENEVRSDLIGGVAGYPWLASAAIGVGAPAWLGKAASAMLSGLTIIVAASAGALTLWPKQPRHTLAISVAAAGGVLMGLVAMIARDDIYLFQKAMTNAAPLCILLLALLTNSLGSRLRLPNAAATVALALLTLQLVYPAQTLIRDFSGRWPGYSERFHTGRDYDLSALRQRLDERCPCALLVNVPPSQDWWWAAYVALSLTRYQPNYQMGYFYDNGPKTLMLPTSRPQTQPQLAVVDSRDDYVGIQGLGQLVYDTGRLRLYEIRTSDTAAFGPRPVGAE